MKKPKAVFAWAVWDPNEGEIISLDLCRKQTTAAEEAHQWRLAGRVGAVPVLVEIRPAPKRRRKRKP